MTVSTKKLVLKKEEMKGGKIFPFGEDTVIEVTNYSVGDYWICLYTKIQKHIRSDSGFDNEAAYYYKLKCFSPLRSNSRIEFLYTEDEDKMKELCLKEVELYLKHLSGKCEDNEFYRIMEREIVSMVEQRSFALDNEEDYKTKLLMNYK